jgi:hypothetical protein
MAAVSSARRVVLVGVAAAIGCLLSGCGEKLTEYHDEEGRFRILLPGTPTPVERKKLQAGQKAVVLEQRSGNWKVVWEDLALPRPLDPEQCLDMACTAAVEKLQGKAVSRKTIHVGDYPGRDLIAEDSTGKVIVRDRMYLVGRRLYHVIATGPKWWVERGITDQVLDSFELEPE